MIVIENKEDVTKVKVISVFSNQEVAVTYDVGELPTAENKTGKNAELFYDKVTKKLYYEYIDRPLTEQERIRGIEESQGDLLLEIAFLKMGGI